MLCTKEGDSFGGPSQNPCSTMTFLHDDFEVSHRLRYALNGFFTTISSGAPPQSPLLESMIRTWSHCHFSTLISIVCTFPSIDSAAVWISNFSFKQSSIKSPLLDHLEHLVPISPRTSPLFCRFFRFQKTLENRTSINHQLNY